ncbi:MAG: PEP-CTERM sorting domain-containing protein [Alphaproteobacteria bacterium]|nr:PEP-CTERM sorting domain-containing protein [Alphaproteobacteria bacterium]
MIEDYSASSFTLSNYNSATGVFDGRVISNPFATTIGQGISLWAQLTSYAGVLNDIAGGVNSASAFTDFQHTMNFPINDPAFLVTPGYGAGSADLGVANHQWTPPAGFLEEGVPTPGTLSIVGLGLLGFAGLNRRRRVAIAL